MGAAIDPERRARARHEEQQPYLGIAENVLQRIGAVVAPPVGHHQRPGVMDAHETGEIAARRAVEPFRAARRQRRERRRLDQRRIFRDDMIEFLDQRGFAGKPVKRFEFRHGFQYGHRVAALCLSRA
jgi:hypothetical protein